MEKKEDYRTRYASEIHLFFRGVDSFRETAEKGHVWVVHHDGFDTLTVEPPEGGQREIAIRIKGVANGEMTVYGDTYSGYVAGAGYLVGRNTGGH